ncbi:hypothetical protein ACI48D_25705 [Massilia sp. LXY-6]|uniref:hypothetical protein n=1 Tax=Massilia sp. LXY-6 TaxID=3379823 RepID=UPI003EE06630
MKSTQSKKSAWFGQQFAIVPLQALLDKRIGPRQLKLLALLAHHANRDGVDCFPGLERLAEMCGFYSKGKPHTSLVSALISNPNFDKPSKKTGKVTKSTGPGLVELGYVEKLGQRGYNKTQSYRLKIADVSTDEVNTFADRKLSDEEYTAKRRTQEKAEFEEFAEALNVEDAEQEKELEAARIRRGAFVFRGTEYTRSEVQQAYHDGDWGDIPPTVVDHFRFSYSFAE